MAPDLGVRVFGREDGRTVHESTGVYKSIKQKVAEKWSARLLDVVSPHKDTASKTMLPVTGHNWCCAAPCVGFQLQAADHGKEGGSGEFDDRTQSFLVNGDTVRLSSLATNANLDLNTFVFVGKYFVSLRICSAVAMHAFLAQVHLLGRTRSRAMTSMLCFPSGICGPRRCLPSHARVNYLFWL